MYRYYSLIFFFLFLCGQKLVAQAPSWQYVKKIGTNQYYADRNGGTNEMRVLGHMFDQKQNQYVLLYFTGDTFYYDGYSYARAIPQGCGGAALLKIRCDGSIAWSKIFSNKNKTEGDYVTRYTMCFGKNENTIILGFNAADREVVRADVDTTIVMPVTNLIKYYSIIYDSLGIKQKIIYRHPDTGQAQVQGYLPGSNQYYIIKNIDTFVFPVKFKNTPLSTGEYLILLDSNFNYTKVSRINTRKIGNGGMDWAIDSTQPFFVTSLIQPNGFYPNPNLYSYVVNKKLFVFFYYTYSIGAVNEKKRLIINRDTVDVSNWGFENLTLTGFFVYNDTGKYLFTKYNRPVRNWKNYLSAHSEMDLMSFQLGKDKNFYYIRSIYVEDTVMAWGTDTVKSTLPYGTKFMNYGSIDTNGNLLWSNNIEMGGTTIDNNDLFYRAALTPSNEIIMAHNMHKWGTDDSYRFKLNGQWYNNDTAPAPATNRNTRPILMKLSRYNQELIALGQNGTRQIDIDYVSINSLGHIHLFGNKMSKGFIIDNDSSDIFYQGTYRDFFIAKYGSANCICDTVTASFNSDTTQYAKVTVQYTGTATDSVLYIWGDGSQNYVKPATAQYTKTYSKDTIVTVKCIAYNNCRQSSIATRTFKILCDTVLNSFIVIDSNIRGRTAVKYKGTSVDSVVYLWGNGTSSVAKPDTAILSKIYNRDTFVTIACIVKNRCGKSDTSFQTVHITCDTLVNQFSILKNLNGSVQVTYTGNSVDTVRFLWGDGMKTPVFSPSNQVVSHLYTNLNADSTKISCIIRNQCGLYDTFSKTIPILCDTPTNQFREVSSIGRTIVVEYTGTSTDTIIYVWGDGNQQTVSNPTTQQISHTYSGFLDSVSITCMIKNKCGKVSTSTLRHKFCQSIQQFKAIQFCDTNYLLTASQDTNRIFQKWSDGSLSNSKTINTSQKLTAIYLLKNGCTYRDSFELTKYISPILQKSKKYLDCKKTPIQLSALYSNVISYLWSTGSVQPSILVSTKGDYIVKITHPCGIFRDTFKVFDTAVAVYDTLRKTVCEKFQWRDSFYTKSGKYTRTISKLNSCDSILTLDLKVGIEPKVTLSYGINYRVEEDYKSYQWYLCSPWKKISNETKKTFSTTSKGSYAVIVSNGECQDTSSCIALYSSSTSQIYSGKSILLYPNPVKDKLHISISNSSNKVVIKQFNLLGQCIFERGYMYQDLITIDTEHLSKGIYLMEVETDLGKEVFKFIKE